jgi:hypothetical protein
MRDNIKLFRNCRHVKKASIGLLSRNTRKSVTSATYFHVHFRVVRLNNFVINDTVNLHINDPSLLAPLKCFSRRLFN